MVMQQCMRCKVLRHLNESFPLSQSYLPPFRSIGDTEGDTEGDTI